MRYEPSLPSFTKNTKKSSEGYSQGISPTVIFTQDPIGAVYHNLCSCTEITKAILN